MYFIPYTRNKMYVYGARIKPRYRYLVTLVCVLSITFGWFYGIYIPIAHTIALNEKHILHTHKQILHMYKVKQSEPVQKKQYALLQQEIDTYINEDTQITYMPLILQSINKADLTIVQYTHLPVLAKQWYLKDILHFTLSGTLPQFYAWLDELAHIPVVIQCKQLLLTYIENQQFSISCALHVTQINKEKIIPST